jgi:hypothetical protein
VIAKQLVGGGEQGRLHSRELADTDTNAMNARRAARLGFHFYSLDE